MGLVCLECYYFFSDELDYYPEAGVWAISLFHEIVMTCMTF